MAPIVTTNGHAPHDSLDEEAFLIADDLIQARAADKIQKPLLCFPRTERAVTDFETFTGNEIDRFVDHAAQFYRKQGLQPVGSRIPVSSMRNVSNPRY